MENKKYLLQMVNGKKIVLDHYQYIEVLRKIDNNHITLVIKLTNKHIIVPVKDIDNIKEIE